MMRVLVTLLAGILSAGAHAPPARQDPPPQFKTGIDVRQLDVVVLDRDGRPVRGLTAADFTVIENGRPQKIATLEEVVVPAEETGPAEWMRTVAPDVKTNDLPLDGRLMVIVMDDAVTRDPQLVEPARRIGREIVARMGPSDLAAVVFTLQNKKGQDFTADRSRLAAAVERFTTGFAPGSALEESLFRQYSVRALAKSAADLRTIEGRRKALIYVSVGVPVDWDDISSPIANLGAEGVTVGGKEAMRDVGEDLQNTLTQAQLSNVAVYAISPRGLDPVVQIVQGGRGPVVPVRVDLRIVDGSDTTVHRATDTLEPALFATGRAGAWQFGVPVDRLAPGPYLLRIDATAGARAARRDVRFTRK